MTPPLLSIITVCRNEASRIQRTIDSVLQQSDSAFEWIVVDGASTDGTLDILRRCKAPLSHLISEPDQGLYDAMNKGIQAAQGEYTLFLNAGDWLENKDVVRLFREQAFCADIVVGDILIRFSNGREQLRRSTDHPLNGDLLYWRCFPHAATFIKRMLFADWGSYDLSFQISADREFFTRAVIRHKATCIPWNHCVSVFTNDGISASMQNRRQLERERKRIRRMHYPAWYRWRRELNEGWVRMLHRIYQRIKVSKDV